MPQQAKEDDELRELELWYAHYNGKNDFSDFKEFGGWTEPWMKQFLQEQQTCGCQVNVNYFT